MRLVTFTEAGRRRIGVVEGDVIADVGAVPNTPATVRELLECGPPAEVLAGALRTAPRIALEGVNLEAPIDNPHHFFAVGLNYRAHAREMNVEPPLKPRLFTKLVTSITGPRSPILHPGFSDTLDYEGELGIVIGRACRNVPRRRAMEVVAGYLIVNDLSVREWVNADLLVLAKGCATFAPLGPWLTTADEVADPQQLRIATHVNGELRQDSSTADMVFDCGTLIEWITRAVALRPGDIITTGSPPGSGAGCSPPRYLRPGDEVRVSIEGLGELRNTVRNADE